jgi:hypothetical protein
VRSARTDRPARRPDLIKTHATPGPEQNRTMITAIVSGKPPQTGLAARAAHVRVIAPGFRDVPVRPHRRLP